MQLVTKFSVDHPIPAALTDQRVDGFVDGIVKQGQLSFTTADGGFAKKLYGRGADQHGPDQP